MDENPSPEDEDEKQYMDITPTPEFQQACREVLGLGDDVEMTPAIVIPAIRDERLGRLISEAHVRIIEAKRRDEEFRRVFGELPPEAEAPPEAS